jgi:aquaporin Z
MTATEASAYWVVQIAGGIAGAAVLQLLTSSFGDVTDQTGALGANDYGVTVSLGNALVLEVLLTFVFSRSSSWSRASPPHPGSPVWPSVWR